MSNAITIGEQSLNISNWAIELGVSRCAFYYRRDNFGETMEEAVLHFYNKKYPERDRMIAAFSKVEFLAKQLREVVKHLREDGPKASTIRIESASCEYIADKLDEAIKEFVGEQSSLASS